MPGSDQPQEKTRVIGREASLKLAIVGGVLVGLIAIYLVWSNLSSTPSEKTVKMIKESERISAGVIDYLDGLPQTENVQLKGFFEKAFSWYQTGEYTEAVDHLNMCLQLRTQDDERAAVLILNGNCLLLLENVPGAEGLYRRALVFADRVETKGASAAAWGNLALIQQRAGNLDSALSLHQEALIRHQKSGSKKEKAMELGNLGLFYQAKRDLDRALAYHQAALDIFKEIDHALGQMSQLSHLGWI
ncbi:MAG: tetratricopeptide repeat protein, partial [Candidatus Zixiibacteriota bacterium]